MIPYGRNPYATRLFVLVLLPLLLMVLVSSGPENGSTGDPDRPRYHFSPDKDTLGALAGMVYYEEEYHLFYLPVPAGDQSGRNGWEHAVSRDLLHWESRPVSFPALPTGSGNDPCTPLPGCIIADQDNLLNLRQGDHTTLLFFYTGLGCGQRIAWSNDRGESWHDYAGNPVIPFDNNDEAQHPKLFFHEESRQWVMILHRKPDGDERTQGFSFFTSTDLVNWEFQSHLAGFRKRPDMVKLRVNNRSDDTRWVLFESDGSYVIGDFDGKQFIPESHRMKSDYGSGYSSPFTFSDSNPVNERCLQMALLKEGEWETQKSRGQYSLASELALRKTSTGLFLTRQPAREIETLSLKSEQWQRKNLIPGINQNLIKQVKGDALRIQGKFNLKTCESFGFMLRTGKKNPGTELLYNVRKQTLTILGQTVPLEPVDQTISLDILIDRTSVEVYANQGKVVISNILFAGETDKGHVLYNTGGELMVEELRITPLSPAWNNPRK